MNNDINKFIYWAPRILSIIFILFLALFSLDVFDSRLNFRQTLIGLFIHNIPSITLSIVLVISWKHEIVGAITFALAGFLYIATLFISSPFEWYMVSWSLIIAGPAFLISILFFVNWIKKRK